MARDVDDEIDEIVKNKMASLKTHNSGVIVYCTNRCGWKLQLERGYDDFPHYCPECGASTAIDVEYSEIEDTKSDKI